MRNVIRITAVLLALALGLSGCVHHSEGPSDESESCVSTTEPENVTIGSATQEETGVSSADTDSDTQDNADGGNSLATASPENESVGESSDNKKPTEAGDKDGSHAGTQSTPDGGWTEAPEDTFPENEPAVDDPSVPTTEEPPVEEQPPASSDPESAEPESTAPTDETTEDPTDAGGGIVLPDDEW